MTKTILYKSSDSNYLEAVCNLLQAGKIVALPTETVYGLAADALNTDAVRKIFIAKGRPNNHPLIVHIKNESKLNLWAKNIPPIVYKLSKLFWPGPLTLILEKNDNINTIVTGGLNTIALRVPSHSIIQNILNEIDGLAAPSANLFKTISPTNASHVLKTLEGKIDAIVDDGPCKLGLESTILDLTTKIPTILRPGPISKFMIEECLGYKISQPYNHNSQVSGNMKEHYKPATTTIMLKTDEILEFLITQNKHKSISIINYSNIDFMNFNVISFKIAANKEEYSKNIYNLMHIADEQNSSLIIIEMPPQIIEWSDVLNRLTKATAS